MLTDLNHDPSPSITPRGYLSRFSPEGTALEMPEFETSPTVPFLSHEKLQETRKEDLFYYESRTENL